MPESSKIYADYIQFRKDGTKYFFEDDRVPDIAKHVENLNEQASAQGQEIDTIKTENNTQDDKLKALEDKNSEQDKEIQVITEKDTAQDTRIQAIEEKNTEQDNRLQEIEKKNEDQDTALDAQVKALERKILDAKVIDTTSETSVTISANTYDDSQVVSLQTGITGKALPKSQYLTVGGYVEVEDSKTTPAGGSTYTCLTTITNVSENSVIFSIHIREHYTSKPGTDVRVSLVTHVIQIKKEAA